MKNLKLTISALVLVGIALMSYGPMSFADENDDSASAGQNEEKSCKDNGSPPAGFSDQSCYTWFIREVAPSKTSCLNGVDMSKPIACTGTSETCFPAIGTGKKGQYCKCTFVCKEPPTTTE